MLLSQIVEVKGPGKGREGAEAQKEAARGGRTSTEEAQQAQEHAEEESESTAEGPEGARDHQVPADATRDGQDQSDMGATGAMPVTDAPAPPPGPEDTNEVEGEVGMPTPPRNGDHLG